MFNRFFKKGVDNLELISIHVPKTAGISFRTLLYKVYGKKYCFNINLGGQKHRRLYNSASLDKITPLRTKVLHGHFTYDEVSDLAISRSLPVIVWVRDPLERVISNYRYAQRQIVTKRHRDDKGLSSMSLIDYARTKRQINLMSRFLRGLPLEDYAFVGISDYFAEEWNALSRLFRWPSVPVVRKNSTSTFPLDLPPVTEEERAEITWLNQEDIALYRSALSLREQRSE